MAHCELRPRIGGSGVLARRYVAYAPYALAARLSRLGSIRRANRRVGGLAPSHIKKYAMSHSAAMGMSENPKERR